MCRPPLPPGHRAITKSTVCPTVERKAMHVILPTGVFDLFQEHYVLRELYNYSTVISY